MGGGVSKADFNAKQREVNELRESCDRLKEKTAEMARSEAAQAETLSKLRKQQEESDQAHRAQMDAYLKLVETQENEAKAMNTALEERKQAEKVMMAQLQQLTSLMQGLRAELKSKDEKVEQLQHKLAGLEMRPTPDEIQKAMASLGYEPNALNIAVAGDTGAGKSSFINALRGLHSEDPNAAKTGTEETTKSITKYIVELEDLRLAIFDIPGAGTINVPRFTYFRDQGLYIMNALIIIWDERMTDTSFDLMKNCLQLRVPFFLVRTKCDRKLYEEVIRRGCVTFLDLKVEPDSLDLGTKSLVRGLRESLRSETRDTAKKYIDKAHEESRMALPTWNYLSHIYLVNRNTLYQWRTSGTTDRYAFDEESLLTGIGSALITNRQNSSGVSQPLIVQ